MSRKMPEIIAINLIAFVEKKLFGGGLNFWISSDVYTSLIIASYQISIKNIMLKELLFISNLLVLDKKLIVKI